MKKLLPIVIALFLFSCSVEKEHDLVITDVTIIDVKTGELIAHQSVAIDGDRISEIYSGEVSFSDSTVIVNGTGRFLIPGLWDMHVHHNWNYEDADPLQISNGIVGVREMWGNMYVKKNLDIARSEGTLDGPEIYTGSVIIDGDPEIWPGSIGVRTPEEARKVALNQIESGVDFLKVYSLLSLDQFDAIAEVANEKGLPFAGHVPDEVTIEHAAKMGMVSAEHMIGVTIGASSIEDSLIAAGGSEYGNGELVRQNFDQARFDSMCKVLVEEELWMCPTLITNKGSAMMLDDDYTNDSRVEYIPNYLYSSWKMDSVRKSNPKTIAYFENQKAYYETVLSFIGPMSDRGVKFLAGSDYPNPWCYPGFSLHDELVLMVEGGMDNLTALQTATINPAIFMQKEEDFGGIEKGKVASLVVLDENPLEEISHTRTIENVILRGKVFSRSELDENLERIKSNLANQFNLFDWFEAAITRDKSVDIALDSLDYILANENILPRLAEEDINGVGYELMIRSMEEGAAKVFKKNVELFPDSYNAYDSYAESQMKMGNYEEAKEYYQKALEINPQFENAQVMLDSLNNSDSWQPHSGGKMVFMPHFEAHLNSDHGH